jgi:hypothetical protein
MPVQTVAITDFTAGWISDKFRGRYEQQAYYRGCSYFENVHAIPQGGVTGREGTLYLGACNNPATKNVIIKYFTVSPTLAYIIELGNLYARVWKDNGSTIVALATPFVGAAATVATPYTAAMLPELSIARAGNSLYIAHRACHSRVLSWSKAAGDVSSFSLDLYHAFSNHQLYGTTHQLTAAMTAGTSSCVLDDVTGYAANDVLVLDPNSATAERLTVQSVTAATKTVTFTGNASNNHAKYGFIGKSNPQVYSSGYLFDGGDATDDNPGVVAVIEGRLVFMSSENYKCRIWASRPYKYTDFTYFDVYTYTTQEVQLDATGQPVLIEVDSTKTTTLNGAISAGATSANLTSGTNFAAGDAIVLGYGLSSSEVVTILTKNVNAITFAACLRDHANLAPVGVKASASLYGRPAYNTVTKYREIIADSHACEFEPGNSSTDADIMEWLASGRGIVAGSAVGEFRIASPLVASMQQMETQSRTGSGRRPPLNAGGGVLFWQNDLRSLREFEWNGQSYATGNLSFLNDELMLATQARQFDLQQNPQGRVWIVCMDGTVLALNYDKAQGFVGWERHVFASPADGVAVATVGGEEHIVFALANATTGDRYLVRLNAGKPVDDARTFVYSSPTTQITVDASFDSKWLWFTTGDASLGSAFVPLNANHVVDLPSAVRALGNGTTVYYGLAFTSKVRTMPLSRQGRYGTAQFNQGRISRLVLRLYKTRSVKVGYVDSAIGLEQASFPAATYATPFTGDKELGYQGNYEREPMVGIVQDTPEAFTVLAVGADVTGE